MSRIYLVEITFVDPVTVSAEAIYACSGTGFSAPDAPGYFAPSVIKAADLDRTIWTDDREFGTGKMALGEIVLSALPLDPGGDYPYDRLQANGCSVAGLDARLLLVDQDADYADAVVIYAGPLETFEFSADGAQITFRWRDAVADLVDKTAQLTQYLGNNAPPEGVEGDSDIKDLWKPLGFGYCPNVSVPCVNKNKPIFQFGGANMLPPTSDARVRFMIRGAVMTVGTARASLALLLANSASAGHWDYYIGPEGAFARPAFADAANGQVTMDVVEGANTAARTVGQIFKRLLVSWGVDPADISASDIATLDTDFPAEARLWLGPDEVKRRDALDEITSSAAAVPWRDADNIWRIRQVGLPAGDPVATFREFGPGVATTEHDLPIVGVEIVAPSDSGAPSQQITVEYDRNFTVQNRDQVYGAVGVDLTRMAWLEKEYRKATTEVDTDVLDAYSNARKLTYRSAIGDRTAAVALAARLQAMFGRIGADKPCWIRVSTNLDEPAVALIQELSVISIVYHRWGLASGRLAVVGRIEYDDATRRATYTVWG